ncbi:TOMM precursor leader peptide-binding protein [Micromonospora sp. WMMD964]|uniref:TOMM precursor leader peptide-binding protein n=1 Tax=Micromonospora sp. WMMD964 TaxID=3016091 RepID=UPI00249CB63E|nr:TOMM precursor leader peptide-binding protein [Micromonospora sp. WMMD964]WFF02777.1 TOMM precursor leader peptide-binding protein [Micromonospora sp. WMMD964]
MSDDVRVRLCRGLAVVPTEESLVVQGSGPRHVFRGRAAGTLLPRLLPLLDGSRDRQEIAAELGLPPERLDRPLALLDQRGLLESAAPPRRGGAPEHVVDYHSRSLDGNGGHPGTGALLDALAVVAVHVVGPAEVTRALAADLRECGVGEVTCGPLTETGVEALSGAERSLVVVVDESRDDPSAVERVAGLCAPHAVPVLRVAADRTHLEIGPFFVPGLTACPGCLRRGRAEAGWPGAATSDATAGKTAGIADATAGETLAGLAATEVLGIVSGASLRAATTVTRIDLDAWDTGQHVVVPYPDCPCDDAGGDGPEPDLVDIGLWMTERVVPAALRAGPPSRAVRRKWRELADERPVHHAHPQRGLPTERLPLPGTFGDGVRPAAPGSLHQPLVADLLARVAGRRRGEADGPSQRWVPSGGQLGSVELHLVTETGVADLPGTIFRYDDLNHALIALRADAVPLADALAGTDLPADRLDAALVFTAAHDRVAGKYQDFAYRLTHLDAGCAVTQLAAVATAHGLRTEFATRWDESLAELLDLQTTGRYVTVVAGLHRGETCH